MKDYKDEKYPGQNAFTKNWSQMDFSVFGKKEDELDTGLDVKILKALG